MKEILPIIAAVFNTELVPHKKEAKKKLKTCLNPGCDNQHTHNNSFCSPECCRMYKDNGH